MKSQNNYSWSLNTRSKNKYSPIFRFLSTASLMMILVVIEACTPWLPNSTSVPESPLQEQDLSPTKICHMETINVFAASSLNNALTEIGAAFQKNNPCVQVVFNFAGSQKLSQQIQEGAPADVFASADEKNMAEVKAAGMLVGQDPQIFAQNSLVAVVCPNTKFKIESIQDLDQPGLKLVVAAKEVPVGDYTNQFLENAVGDPEFGQVYSDAVKANEVSFEVDVKAVLTKVDLCEADAGFVYRSDGISNTTPGVKMIIIPDALNVTAMYPIAALNASINPDLAQKFVDFVLSAEGQLILVKYGLKSAE
jgi:molybdate transport system substrate-binding protein